jgi:hypothetical protein
VCGIAFTTSTAQQRHQTSSRSLLPRLVTCSTATPSPIVACVPCQKSGGGNEDERASWCVDRYGDNAESTYGQCAATATIVSREEEEISKMNISVQGVEDQSTRSRSGTKQCQYFHSLVDRKGIGYSSVVRRWHV